MPASLSTTILSLIIISLSLPAELLHFALHRLQLRNLESFKCCCWSPVAGLLLACSTSLGAIPFGGLVLLIIAVNLFCGDGKTDAVAIPDPSHMTAVASSAADVLASITRTMTRKHFKELGAGMPDIDRSVSPGGQEKACGRKWWRDHFL